MKNEIKYHEILYNKNIYTFNFPKLFDLCFQNPPYNRVEQGETYTTINPLEHDEKIKTNELKGLIKKTIKSIANKPVIRIYINGSATDNNHPITETALGAEQFEVLINGLKDLNCNAIYVENMTCHGAHKFKNDWKDEIDIIDTLNKADIKQNVYYGHVSKTDRFAAEPSMIELYKFDKKRK